MKNAFHIEWLLGCLLSIPLLVGCCAQMGVGQDEQPTKLVAEKPERSPVSGFRAEITAAWPGASPFEVEETLAAPIEHAINSMPGLESVRTHIGYSRCKTTLKFNDDADAKECMRELNARLHAIPELPVGAGEIRLQILPPPGRSPLWVVWNSTAKNRPLTPKNMQELRDRITRLPNVDEVQTYGAQQSFLEVVVDEAAIRRHGVSFQEIKDVVDKWKVEQKKTRSARKPPEVSELAILTIGYSKSNGAVLLRDVAEVRSEVHSASPVEWNGQPSSAMSISLTMPSRIKEQRELAAQLNERLLKWQQDLELEGELSLAFPTKGADMRVKINFPLGASADVKDRVFKQAKKELSTLVNDHSRLLIETENDVEIHIGPIPDTDSLIQKSYSRLLSIPGVNVSVANLRDASLPIIAKISGPKLEALRSWSDKITSEVRLLHGVSGISVVGAAVAPELEIEIDKAKAERLGVDRATLIKLATASLAKSPLPSDADFPIVVRRKANVRPADISEMMMSLPDGRQMRVSQVADVRMRSAPRRLVHVDLQRAIEIHIQVDSKDSYGSVAKDLETILLSTRPVELSDAFRSGLEVP